MKQTEQIVRTLKIILREQGVTYRELARRIDLSESSVKRIFSSGTMGLDLAEKICQKIGLSLFELLGRARAAEEQTLYVLKLREEEALTTDPRFYFFFWYVIGRVPLKDIMKRFRMKAAEAEQFLLRLDRLKFIELRDNLRYTVLIPRNVRWNENGPIERHIVRQIMPEFLKGRFNGETDYRRQLVVRAKPATILKYRQKLEVLVEAMFREMLTTESVLDDSETIGLMVAFGKLNFSLQKKFRHLGELPPS